MPPKQQRVVVQSSRRPAHKGYFSKAYYELTSSQNASVVRSVAIFGVSKLWLLDGELILQNRPAPAKEEGFGGHR
jgi:hypothetical protein